MRALLDPDHQRALRLSPHGGLEKWSITSEASQRVGFDQTRDYQDAHLLQGCEPTWFWLQHHRGIHRGDWQTLSLSEPIELVGAAAPMQAAACAPSAQMAALVDHSGAIFLFDMELGRVIHEGSTRHRIAQASLSPNGRYLALCTHGTGRVLVLARAETSYMLQEHLRTLETRHAPPRPQPASERTRTAVVFDPMGEHLVLVETSAADHEGFPAGWRCNLMLFEIASGRLMWSAPVDAHLTGDTRDLDAIDAADGLLSLPTFSPDGRQLLLGSSAGIVVVLDTHDGALVRYAHVGAAVTLTELAIDSAGRRLAARTARGDLLDISHVLDDHHEL